MTNDEKTMLISYITTNFTPATFHTFLVAEIWPAFKSRARDPLHPYYVDARDGQQVTESFVKSGEIILNPKTGATWRFEKSLKRLILATIE